MLAGYPAMRCDYVVPGAGPTGGGRAAGEAEAAGKAGPWQSWRPVPSRCWRPQAASRRCRDMCSLGCLRQGRQTFQVTLGVNPPGDLAGNRAVVDTVVRTFEIAVSGGDDTRRRPHARVGA